jgi:hypothetical protein
VRIFVLEDLDVVLLFAVEFSLLVFLVLVFFVLPDPTRRRGPVVGRIKLMRLGMLGFLLEHWERHVRGRGLRHPGRFVLFRRWDEPLDARLDFLEVFEFGSGAGTGTLSASLGG